MDDKEIVDLFWTRAEIAISETAKKYGRYCYYIANNILHNNEDAEECVNDTYHGAWKTIPPQCPQMLSTFLGKITRNIALNKYKQYNSQKRGGGQVQVALSELEDCISAPNEIEALADEGLLVDCINSFLYEQPKGKRDIFIRRYWYLSPISDISEQFGMSESKVTSILFRLRKELKHYLLKEGITI